MRMHQNIVSQNASRLYLRSDKVKGSLNLFIYKDFMRRTVGCIISFENQTTGKSPFFPICNTLKVN